MDKHKSSRREDAPMNHMYKNYVGESKAGLKHDGYESESFGECLSKTKELAEWAERILKRGK